jgi:hypothetical protein
VDAGRPRRRQPAAACFPEISVVDQLQIGPTTFESQRAAGITTVLTGPRGGVFQGRSAVINLGDESADSRFSRRHSRSISGSAAPRGLSRIADGSLRLSAPVAARCAPLSGGVVTLSCLPTRSDTSRTQPIGWRHSSR